MIPLVQRDQGDTSPNVNAQLLVGGSPYLALASGASVTAIVAGTVGSGVTATYQRFVLPASWSVPSSGDASVTFALSPSGMTSYPCATAGVFGMEIRAVDSTGLVTQWPSNKPIPFIVRAKL